MKVSDNKQGFTLVEVVISMFIIMIGIAGSMSMSVWQMRSTSFNITSSQAVATGQEFLEEMNELLYNDITDGSSTRRDYDLQWTVTEHNRCKLVSVRVAWKHNEDTHNVTVKDIFPDDNVYGYKIVE